MYTYLCTSGNYQQALQCYKQIHKQFPDNLDCLRFMVRLCSDLGLKESQEYSLKLRKAEKAAEAKHQREHSGSSGGSLKSRGRGLTANVMGGGLRASNESSRHKERILSGESGG